MKHSTQLKQALVGSVLSLLMFPLFAGPGTLVNSPLFINATVASNIMFMVDNSLSMEHVVEESTSGDPDKYDSSITYITDCTSPVAASTKVFIYINGGRPYARYNYDSGAGLLVDYNASNKTTGAICFAPNTNYSAGLHADSGGVRPKYNFTALYSGNFLNWYFKYNNTNNGGSVGANWTSGATYPYKPGTQIRRIVARDSMTTLITALEASDLDVRVGLAGMGSSSNRGVKIFDPIKHLDSTQLSNITTNLANLGNSSGTPLARTLLEIGKYFKGDVSTSGAGPNNGSLAVGAGQNDTNQGYTGNFTLHPDTSPTSISSSTLFPGSVKYDSSKTASPIQYWCQNNFAVVVTDGLPTVDQTEIPTELTDYDGDCTGASPSCKNSSPGATSTTPHFDMKDGSLSYIYEQNIYSPSDYFDDVAQAMFEIDLRPDIDDYNGNDVKNNLITYTIAFADQDALNNQLIKDAGTQGGGEAISATDGPDLIKKFTDVTNKILATTSSAAAVTFNTSTLGSDTAVYQSLFSTSRWSGEVLSFPIDPVTGNIQFGCNLDVDKNCWSASAHLDTLAYDSLAKSFTDNREIITFDSSTNKGIPFTTPADFTAPVAGEITTTMINDLCAGPGAPLVSGVACTSATSSAKTASQTFVSQMVDYIRGDRTYEDITNSPTFRTRQTVLGDIINAAPVFIGSPPLPWDSTESASNKFGTTGNRYSDFKSAQANRTKVLYASANDGMLHGFRTETDSTSTTQTNLAGDELFAFMPSFVFSNQAKEGYHHLAEPTYTHKYYLDLSPTFTDYYGVTKDSANAPGYATASRDWHTVLIGGSRGGAKRGIFALDVTYPLTLTEATAADKVLWEFTNSDDVDLGFTYSKPTIVMTQAVDGSGFNRWAAIFGNGYQNDSGAVTNGSSCTAQLYVVFLDGGLDGTWTLGTNPNTADYMKIDTKVGTTAAGDCNGLSTPALADLDGDKILDRVYAGDVKGNMWAFDFTCGNSGCSSSDFKVAYKQGSTPKPLFTAMDNQTTPQPQPIMAKPILARVPQTPSGASKDPNILVLFGTGKYHSAGDNTGTSKINTFYGIWDSGTGKLTDDRSNTSTANLVQQVMTTTTTAYGQIRNITSNPIDWTKKYGWYIDLDPQNTTTYEAEERSVVTPAIRSNVLFFNTLIPDSQKCGFGGSGWLMSVDVATGGAPSSTVFDVNKDGVVDSTDDINGKVAVGEKFNGIPADSSFIGDNQYTQSSDKSIQKRKIKLEGGLREGRLSWRELKPDN